MILFLYGQDTYRSRQKAAEIVKEYQKVRPRAVHVRAIDCSKADAEDLKNEFDTISLFEQKKLLLLRDLFSNAEVVRFFDERKKQLLESSHHIVVVLQQAELKDKTKNPLYQWLKKHATCQEFSPLPPAKLLLWIQREFTRYGVACSSRAAELLALRAGNDLWTLSQEVRKIAAFKKSEAKPVVKESDISLLVGGKAQADVFATIDALASRNKKQAFDLLLRHLQKGDSAYYLFSMVHYQFRVLLEIRDMLDRQLSFAQMVSESKLHPYVLKKGVGVAQNFSSPQLKNIYQKLFEVDFAMKTGKVESEGAFDVFVASL